MRGDDLLEQIYGYLSQKHPEGPEWDQPEFHCFRDCDPLLRSIVAMDTVESEISNGAWGQLLWNTFPNWREVLSLAKSGYELMGATEQATAIDPLASKMDAHQAACASAQDRARSGSFEQEFGSFTAIGYSDTEFKPQLAFTDASLADRRCEWLFKNQAVVQRALTA